MTLNGNNVAYLTDIVLFVETFNDCCISLGLYHFILFLTGVAFTGALHNSKYISHLHSIVVPAPSVPLPVILSSVSKTISGIISSSSTKVLLTLALHLVRIEVCWSSSLSKAEVVLRSNVEFPHKYVLD